MRTDRFEYGDVERWLSQQEKPLLVEMLARLAVSDVRARNLVEQRMEIATYLRASTDLIRLKQLLKKAIVPLEFVRWKHEFAYSAKVDDAISMIRDLAASGHASEARELCEYALDCMEQAFELIDEGAHLGDSYDAVLDMHLDYCRRAPPDSKHLASWIVRMRNTSVLERFQDAPARYAKLLTAWASDKL
jgi:hypothetical protein